MKLMMLAENIIPYHCIRYCIKTIIEKFIDIMKFLVQPDKVKQGSTNEIRENYVKRKRRYVSLAS
jgi:hypothetical protein